MNLPEPPWGARGVRPVTLRVSKDLARTLRTLVPGVEEVRGGVRCSLDTLPTLARLGAPVEGVSLPCFSGSTGAAEFAGFEEYQRCFASKLRGYQKQMVSFLALRGAAINADPMRCLSGDTWLTVRVQGKHLERLTLKELHARYHGLLDRKPLGDAPPDAPTLEVHSVSAHDTLVWNTITLIHGPAQRPCLRVRLSNGALLVGSSEHRVWRACGAPGVSVSTELGSLRVGDVLVVAPRSPLYTAASSFKLTIGATVIAISEHGECETFDLTMRNPWNNYVANSVVVANSGKTPTTLAAASLLGFERVLIVCPSLAKLVWASEVAKWMGLPSTLLYGRSAALARVYDQTLGRKVKDAAVPRLLEESRFVITNYDILVPQGVRSASGVLSTREDLPGWTETLRETFKPQLIIADEAHLLRGRGAAGRKGKSRREQLMALARTVPRFWALTGTPVYGRVADLWALLDVVTGGLFGNQWAFDARFAEGHRGEYGWVNAGASNIDELKERLDCVMLKRTRAEILPELPKKLRQVVKLEVEGLVPVKAKAGVSKLHAALRGTAEAKAPYVAEAVLNECAEGAKVIVYSYLREAAAGLAQRIADGAAADVRLNSRGFRVWSVSGETSVETRFAQAQAFREWVGAGAFVATIDSMPVAISLKGAQSVHFADVTFDPASLLQAEDRPYEVGSGGLTVVYYVAEKTVDEHVIELVLAKMETLENVVNEVAAGEFRQAFSGGPGMNEEDLAEEVWRRMEAAAEVAG